MCCRINERLRLFYGIEILPPFVQFDKSLLGNVPRIFRVADEFSDKLEYRFKIFQKESFVFLVVCQYVIHRFLFC